MKLSGLILLGAISCAYGLGSDQTPLSAKIPDFLWECYNDSFYYTKDNLLPMTMSTLISLVNKAENALPNMNIRTLTPALLNRFRFDGIEWNPRAEASDGVIPFSASGEEFDLYRVLFDSLIPSQNNQIPNETFSQLERCTLHWMLSVSINVWARPEGDDVCQNLVSSNSMLRVPRSAEELEDDVEEDYNTDYQERAGNFQHVYPSTNTDYDQTDCPDENGVVFDKYGSVSPGIVLAGVAAGLQPQSVSTSTLIAQQPSTRSRSRRPNTKPAAGTTFADTTQVQNTWAATLAGILAENALIQGPQGNIQVVDGGWNDTVLPKYYFLKDKTRSSLTAAKLRGALDGYIIASNIANWYQKSSSTLKLSDLLDMYYHSGVFDLSFRACNRKAFINTFGNTITDQAYSFALVLQNELKSVSMQPPAIKQYVSEAIDNFDSYFSQDNADRQCPDSATYRSLSQNPDSSSSIPQTDLYFIVDFSADFSFMKNVITYLGERILEKPYSNSNITVINAKDGTVFIDSVQTSEGLFQNFTAVNYTRGQRGFDMKMSLSYLRQHFSDKMNYEKAQRAPVGGPSWLAVFIPTASSAIPDSDRDSINDKLNYFQERLPDVTLLYLTPGTKDKFTPFARNATDIYTMTLDPSQLPANLKPLLDRIATNPQRIVNPTCGSSWSGDSYDTLQNDFYLAPYVKSYFRMESNYFFGCSDCQLTVQGNWVQGKLQVCWSRYLANPSGNATSRGNVNCTSFADSLQIDLSKFCSGNDYVSDCNPLYFSVDRTPPGWGSCSDPDCPSGGATKFTISHQGLSCYSGGAHLIFSPILLVVLLCVQLGRLF